MVVPVKSDSGPELLSLTPYRPVPCLPALYQNQRRISRLGLGLDHSLGVAGNSARRYGDITGPHGPGQASQGCLCRNDDRGQSTVMSEGLSLARRALRRACRGGRNIHNKHLWLSRQKVRLFFVHNLIESSLTYKMELLYYSKEEDTEAQRG